MMYDFITGLQFLTRIRLYKQTSWSSESFGRSVKFFPLIGGIIGIIMAAFVYICENFIPGIAGYLPAHLFAALLLAIPILLAGGLLCDGFMDTFDGLLSGKPRADMLKIMKDSRVGAHGVTSFILLILLKWAVLLDMPSTVLLTAVLVAPIIGRFAMVIGIKAYPYARPEGIGKAFAHYSGRYTIHFAALCTLLIIIPLGAKAITALMVSIVFTMLFCGYVTKVLGGLTGDVYGALNELIELLVLFVFLF